MAERRDPRRAAELAGLRRAREALAEPKPRREKQAAGFASRKKPRRKPGDPHVKRTAKADHQWRHDSWDWVLRKRERKWAGENWETGEMLPNTLEFWVESALRGKRGVVLTYRKTLELAVRLGMAPASDAVDAAPHRPIADGEVALGAELVDADALDGGDGALQLDLPFGGVGSLDEQEAVQECCEDAPVDEAE